MHKIKTIKIADFTLLIKRSIALVFLSTCLINSPSFANESEILADKQLAWNFTLKNQQHENIKLSELRGQVIMINFWATWCGACLQQFPLIRRYFQKYKSKDFTILSINIDDDLTKATRFVDKRHFDYPILFDNTNVVSRLYSADDLPLFILIDRDGFIRYTLDESQIKQQKITQQVIEGLLHE